MSPVALFPFPLYPCGCDPSAVQNGRQQTPQCANPLAPAIITMTTNGGGLPTSPWVVASARPKPWKSRVPLCWECEPRGAGTADKTCGKNEPAVRGSLSISSQPLRSETSSLSRRSKTSAVWNCGKVSWARVEVSFATGFAHSVGGYAPKPKNFPTNGKCNLVTTLTIHQAAWVKP